MRIYIDESGNFLLSAGKEHAFSVVGAVVIPGRFAGKIEEGFSKLTQHWPREKGEIKGRVLGEQHVADLCAFLEPFHVLFEATVLDMNLDPPENAKWHQKRQAEKITEHLTDRHFPAVRDKVWELRRTLEKMPPQLYAQFLAQTQLVWRALIHAILYHCQRYPGELAKFEWVIDAKDRSPTESELWWQDVVMPFLESKSSRDPIPRLQGGDYSAFYRNFPLQKAPEHVRERMEKPDELVGDLKGIFYRAISFQQSHLSVGLQIADILTNALRRALSGRLGEPGWRALGALMIANRREGSIHFIAMGSEHKKEEVLVPKAILKIGRGRRGMVTEAKPLGGRKLPGRD